MTDEQRPPNALLTNFAVAHATGLHRDVSKVLADVIRNFQPFQAKFKRNAINVVVQKSVLRVTAASYFER